MIKHTDQVEEFVMKEDEDWRKFCSKQVQDRIDWNDEGCKMSQDGIPRGFVLQTVATKQAMSQWPIFHRKKRRITELTWSK